MDYKKNIKIIGFDLDQTLYPKSPEVDEAIQSYIYEKISEYKKINLKKAEILFKDLYKNGSGLSGSKSLEALGMPNATDIIQIALEKANILKYLKPDKKVIDLLKQLSKRYKIDLITGSGSKITRDKLDHLNIPTKIFRNIITKDDASKSDGECFRIWLSKYKGIKPEEFLYIGDRITTDYIVPSALGIKCILVNIKEKTDSATCPQLRFLIDIEKYL